MNPSDYVWPDPLQPDQDASTSASQPQAAPCLQPDSPASSQDTTFFTPPPTPEGRPFFNETSSLLLDPPSIPQRQLRSFPNVPIHMPAPRVPTAMPSALRRSVGEGRRPNIPRRVRFASELSDTPSPRADPPLFRAEHLRNDQASIAPGHPGSSHTNLPPQPTNDRVSPSIGDAVATDTRETEREICSHCKAKLSGRKLVLAFDGTSNQFGAKNTNVVELYARIEKSDEQLTYYNSGIGTYANPSRKLSWAYIKMAIENKIDLAIAWNFEKIVLAGYRWLSENFRPGDQIFLFGFSRGAYQCRTLAAMIERVGLIFPGNEEQIPFAYELYASAGSKRSRKLQAHTIPNRVTTDIGQSNRNEADEDIDMAARFKETFSRRDVRVHFLGNWDCVSSVGILRGKALPLTDSCDHICHFRHALALDECRVKFLPECVSPRVGEERSGTSEAGSEAHGWDSDSLTLSADNGQESQVEKSQPPLHTKEVWFPGCHSDIGGGNKPNKKLNSNDVPALWMANEAMMAGLRLEASKVDGWDLSRLRSERPRESLTWFWWLLEGFPVKRPRDRDPLIMTWMPHRGKGRRIQKGQKVHASVVFKSEYKPKATFSEEYRGLEWSKIIGKGNQHDIGWAKGLDDVLEMDLYDCTAGASLIAQLAAVDFAQVGVVKEILDRLYFIAEFEAGATSITEADREFKTLATVLATGHLSSRIQVMKVLGRVPEHWNCRIALWETEIPVKLVEIASFEGQDEGLRNHAAKAIVQLCQVDPRSFHPRYGFQVPLGYQRLFSSNFSPKLGGIIMHYLVSADPTSGARALGVVTNNATFRAALLEGNEDSIVELARMLSSKLTHIRIAAARGLSHLAKHDDIRTAILETSAIGLLVDILSIEYRDVLFSAIQKSPSFEKHENELASRDTKNAISWRRRIVRISNNRLKASGVKSILTPHAVIKTDIVSLLEAHSIEFQDILSTIKEIADDGGNLEPAIQQHIVEAVRNAESEELDHASISLVSEFVNWVVKAAESESSEQRKSSLDSLVQLARYPDSRAKILMTNIFPSLAHLARSGHSETRIPNAYYLLLSELTKHSESRDQILKTNIIPSLAHTVKGGSPDGLHIFLLTLAEDDETRVRLLKTNIIDSLAQILKSNSEDARNSSLRLLSKLAEYANSRSEILRTDTIESLAGFTKSSEIRMPSSYYLLLSELATNVDSQPRMLGTNFIQSLAHHAKTKLDLPDDRLLSKLTGNDNCRTRLLDTDIIDSLACMLESGRENVHDKCCGLLSELAAYEDSRPRILETNVIQSLVRTANSSNTGVPDSASLSLLLELAKHEDSCSQILETNIIQSLARMAQSNETHLPDSHYLLLSELAEHAKSRAQILKTDFIQSLARTLKGGSPEKFHRLLSVLARFEEARARLLNTDIIDSLVRMLKSSDEDEYGTCCRLLSELAEYPNSRIQILNTDFMQSLAHILVSSGVRKPDFSYRKLFLSLAQHEECRAQLLNSNVLPSLADGLKSSDEIIQNDCRRLLWELEEYEEFKHLVRQIIDRATPGSGAPFMRTPSPIPGVIPQIPGPYVPTPYQAGTSNYNELGNRRFGTVDESQNPPMMYNQVPGWGSSVPSHVPWGAPRAYSPLGPFDATRPKDMDNAHTYERSSRISPRPLARSQHLGDMYPTMYNRSSGWGTTSPVSSHTSWGAAGTHLPLGPSNAGRPRGDTYPARMYEESVSSSSPGPPTPPSPLSSQTILGGAYPTLTSWDSGLNHVRPHGTRPWMERPTGYGPATRLSTLGPTSSSTAASDGKCDDVDHFAAGKNYGILDPLLVKALKAEVRLNPILLPAAEDSDRVHLKWNMLFPSHDCCRSDGPWTNGRLEPATFPRVTYLSLISRTFPWTIKIYALDKTAGVTCTDVINGIADCLQSPMLQSEYQGPLPQAKRDAIADAYRRNRSRIHNTPGRMIQDSYLRVDYLCQETKFAGIKENEDFVRERLGCGDVPPCIFVLKCENRYPSSSRMRRSEAGTSIRDG